MDLLELATLVQETARELGEDSRVVRAGRECGLTEVDLVFQGPTGDYAGDSVFKGDGYQGSGKQGRTLEKAADVFARFLTLLRNWASFARLHGLTEVFVTVRRFSGATNRDLYIKEDPSRVIPDDPMVMF